MPILWRPIALRVKITAETEHPAFFPFNYQHVLQAVLYNMIRNSSSEHAAFLHKRGYVKDGIDKLFKFFTFSKLSFTPHIIGKGGFQKVRQIEFMFSTCTEKSFRHLILGMFSKGKMRFSLAGQHIGFNIVNAEVLEDPKLSGKEKFTCLSPIAVATQAENDRGQAVPHFLDYMKPSEREHFIENLKKKPGE
jgi:CRISPR-associated endoribonuclease Cas6